MKQFIVICIAALALFVPPLAGAEEFNHSEHQEYLEGEPCLTCHVEEAESITPEKEICLECHESELIDEVTFPGLKSHDSTWTLSHRAAAKSDVMNCSACHGQEDCLECHKAGFADEMGALGSSMMNVHRSDFTVTHPIDARSNPQLCVSCHENRFCVECHEEFDQAGFELSSHRRTFSDISPNGTRHDQFDESQCQVCHPDSVLPRHEWTSSHAREARKNLVTCQACHPEGQVCLKCHSATSGLGVNPHPGDWDDIDGRLKKASNGRTCRKCH